MIIGEILLSEGVNPLGGRTYNIPINIAQGCNGAQLNINVVYNIHYRHGLSGKSNSTYILQINMIEKNT